jgi:large subunit ribosomal protein L23
MSKIYEIIKRPLVTEKSQAGQVLNQVVFEVALDANKYTVRDAVEKLFDVNVVNVNTLIMQGKRKRFGQNFGKRSNWKKAVVTLKDGDTIDFYGEEEEVAE